MATSTRRTFQGGQVVAESVTSSENVIKMVTRSITERALGQQAAVKQSPNTPALAAAGGLVQRLGGEPLKPRAQQYTGAVPVGGVVQVNQGVATGQPLVGGATALAPQPSAWLQGEGNPNTLGLVPRVRGDRYYDKLGKALWVWQQTGDEVAEWVALGGIQVGEADPVDPGRFDGDQFVNALSGALFVWLALSEEWLPVSGGAEVQVLDAAPVVAPPSDQAVAFVRDPKEVYVWDAEAVTPAWLGPYGGGGGGGAQIAVCNFSDSSNFEFDFRNVPWDTPRKDDFTATFATNGQIVIPAAGWYRLSMYLYQVALDTGIERQITYQFELTLRNAAASIIDLGEDKQRLLTFGGFSNFDPGTGQCEWTFAAPEPGRADLFWYWYGETSGGGIIDQAFVNGRFMLEKLS